MEELSEYEKQLLNQSLLEEFLPMLVREMIFRGIIDIKKKEDIKYLWDTVRRNTHLTKEIKITTQIHNEFIRQSKFSLKKKDYFVAIILLATAIEHILNIYYVERLYIQKISDVEVRDIIRKTNLDAKIGWLLSMTGRVVIPPNLRKNIIKIFELRNSIVHYKPLLSNLDHTTYEKLMKEIEKLDFDQIQKCPSELEKVLQNELNTVDPNRILAVELTEKLLSHLPKIPSKDLKKAEKKLMSLRLTDKN